MRRLLAAIVTCGLLSVALAAAAPALAAGRLPGGIARISVTISSPLKTGSGSRKPVHVTLSRAATVAMVVKATNALRVARVHGACPMFMRVGPELSVVFRNSKGTELAAAWVAVTQGSRGDSGSSFCFPIRLVSSGRTTDLLGNGWVRMIGRLAGTAIS